MSSRPLWFAWLPMPSVCECACEWVTVICRVKVVWWYEVHWIWKLSWEHITCINKTLTKKNKLFCKFFLCIQHTLLHINLSQRQGTMGTTIQTSLSKVWPVWLKLLRISLSFIQLFGHWPKDWTNSNFNLMLVVDEKLRHHQSNINVCTRFHDDPANSQGTTSWSYPLGKMDICTSICSSATCCIMIDFRPQSTMNVKD